MSEVVPVTEAPESHAITDQPIEGSPAAATPDPDVTTLMKRLSGKDQALTAAQRERDAIKAERDSLAAWKAETEQANMSELQKVQADRDRLANEAATARAEAAAVRLGSKYPLAAELLGDDLSKFDEVRVAEINGRLAKELAAESEPEPRVDPNSPRRSAPRPPADDLDSATAALKSATSVFYTDGSSWGSTVRR